MSPGLGPLPPGGGPEPAPGAVDPVTQLAPMFAALPRSTVTRIKLGLRVFDWLSFPWRFSRSRPDARREFLRRVEAHGSPSSRDLVLFLKVLCGIGYGSDRRVQAAVGYEATCAVEAEGAARRPPTPVRAPLGELEPSGSEEECDFVVVGSGAGGAAAATVLAEAGLEVVVLEAGPYLDRNTYPQEPIAAITSLYRDAGLTVAMGRPAVPTPVGRAVGGTTVINSGTCFRTPQPVLERWAAEHGIEWARALDPDFAEIEEMLDVRPVDPERMGRNGQLLREGAEALGVEHAPLRRNAGTCVQCSSCPTGCRLDAKRAMHVSYLPRAVTAGARVRAGVEARRIAFERGRAVGVQCHTGVADQRAGGWRPFGVRARRGVVLAGGAFGTPELLLRSGFRSASGELGRNLRIHPACWVGARFAEEVRGWEGIMQSYAVSEWEAQGVLLEATFTPLAFGGQWLPGTGAEHQQRLLAFDHLASTGVHLSDRSSGRVGLARDGSLRITYQLTRDDSHRILFGIARAAELYYAAGAREVYPQISGIATLPRTRIAELEAAPPPRRALRLEAFHPMGTARMDSDPRRGVSDTDGAVHGTAGLYVADGSLLPSSLGVNPMITIIAIASRVAGQIAAATA
jgi:choline dehydrogenase-like flavoprotein